jgi:hypothetical protein
MTNALLISAWRTEHNNSEESSQWVVAVGRGGRVDGLIFEEQGA